MTVPHLIATPSSASEAAVSSRDSVLVAEDDPVLRRMLQSWLQKWDYRVISVDNGLDAWRVLQQEDGPRLAILDWMMPGLDGLELCQRIRSQQTGVYKYVLLVTARVNTGDVIAGLDAGADDYLVKPFDLNELRARVRAGKRILQLQEALLAVQTELRFESAHDNLTGVWNRRAIMDLLHRETQRALRIGIPLGVMMVDIDHFKNINDSHGHPTGDAVLREVARRMVASVRNYDHVGRYGGEEFLIVLAECSAGDLAATAERMRACVAGLPIETDTGPVTVTISLGLAAGQPGDAATIKGEELLRAADIALYCAKSKGRNRFEYAFEACKVEASLARATI